MPIHITSDCWAKWQPAFAELYADYGFFADTERNFNTFIAWYRGEGSSFRTESTHWRFVIDTIRSGDEIIDVTAITIITKTENGSKRDGWVITRSCDVHGVLHAAKVVDGRKLAWYKVSSDGRVLGHCCQEECIGHNTKHIPTRSWDATRWTALRHSHAQEIISLRQEIQQQRAEASKKRKRSEVIVIDDDVESSPIVRKLRKAKAKLEGNVSASETQVNDLEKKLKNLRASFESQEAKMRTELETRLKEAARTLQQMTADKMNAEKQVSAHEREMRKVREKAEEEKKAMQAYYVEELRKKDSVLEQKNNVISMKQAAIDKLRDVDKIYLENQRLLQKEQNQRVEINNLKRKSTERKMNQKTADAHDKNLQDAISNKEAELESLRLQLQHRTTDAHRLKEDLDNQSNNVVPSLLSSIQIKTERVNELEGQLDSVMSANMSRLHTESPSHVGNTRSGAANFQQGLHSHQGSSVSGNGTAQSSHRQKKRRHRHSEAEIKKE
ncbi:hypothetical protein CcaCcLH18_05716 [Colletotrichum camelliae]|nr:hypothetical protein CcaCcLH18_05716 [Colletotrichum camelliae]